MMKTRSSEMSMHQRVVPTVFEPLSQLCRRVMVHHIDVQFALTTQS